MLDAVTKGYLTLHPASAARTLARLDSRDAAAALDAMPRHLAGQVVSSMAPAPAARCLAVLPLGVAAEILNRTGLTSAVTVLRAMDDTQVRRLLAQLPRPKAAQMRLRLRFSEWVIGALVDEDVLTLSPDHHVGDALRLFRSSTQLNGQTIIVVDKDRRLAGIVDLQDLLSNPDRRPVRKLMQPATHVLSARAALQSVVNHPAWITHDNLPVINRTGIFQGVLRRSRVMQEEAPLMREIVERNEQTTTRTALADIFWLAIGALIVHSERRNERSMRDA